MDTELIDRVAALVADLDRGTADDPVVDWSAGPPEGGLDHGYALGVWLLSACLDEPALAPLAEALTRPQSPARPVAGKRAPFLDEPRWQNPFAIACGRLVARGPGPSAPSRSRSRYEASRTRRSHRRFSACCSRGPRSKARRQSW